MPNRYSPSSLRTFESLCPKALDFYLARTPWIAGPFDVGTAAHAFLEGVALAVADGAEWPDDREEISARIATALIAGRWEGQDHPIEPAQVYEGRDLAMRWLESNPPQGSDMVERGAAFDSDWRPVEWESERARYRLVFDLVREYEDGDEETSFTVAEATDYKTSWQTNEAELRQSIQMASQALALSILFPGCDVYRIRLVNLRTCRAYSLDYTAEEVAEIKPRIEQALSAADVEPRLARVGAQCLKCPYVTKCDAAQSAFASAVIPTDAVQLATAYIAARATADKLQDLVKSACDGVGAITVPGGTVGFIESSETRVGPDKSLALFDDWQMRGGEARGFIKAIGGVGATQVEAIGKVIFKHAGERRTWKAGFVTVESKPRFRVKASEEEIPE